MFIYSPIVLAIRPVTVEQLNKKCEQKLLEINAAITAYKNTKGFYPEYIYGGDPLSWGPGIPSPDPLLSGGYLPAYPVNTFNLARTSFEPRRESGLLALWFGHK